MTEARRYGGQPAAERDDGRRARLREAVGAYLQPLLADARKASSSPLDSTAIPNAEMLGPASVAAS